MSVSFVRPDVSQLTLRFFERAVHPEFFEVRKVSVLRLPDFEVALRICDSGHWLEFRSGQSVVSEVLASRQQPFPVRHQLLERRVKGNRDETLRLPDGLKYSVSFQIEHLAPTQFLAMHEELFADCERTPLSHCFESENRLAPAALSFLQTDVWEDSLLVHSYHTFPQDCALVKTQTLFELIEPLGD